MAVGDPVIFITKEMPPAASVAGIDTYPGASTPAERFVDRAFDGGSADEFIDYLAFIAGYDDTNGIEWKIPWMPAAATTGNVQLGVALRNIAIESEDLDVSHSYVFQEVQDAAPGTQGHVAEAVITMTDAQMDGAGNGSWVVVRFRREASDTTNDTMVGDLLLKNYPVGLQKAA